MAELPGPHMIRRRIDHSLFFVYRIAPPQNLRPNFVRLPQKIKPLPPVKSHMDPAALRLPVKNNIVLKPLIIQDSKPVALFPPRITEAPPVPPRRILLLRKRHKPQPIPPPPIQLPGRLLPPQPHQNRKIPPGLHKPLSLISHLHSLFSVFPMTFVIFPCLFYSFSPITTLTMSVTLVKSRKFAIRIYNLYKHLSDSRKEYILAKQLLRSGTSIGANLSEAHYSISKKEFLAKVTISLKECAETEYWLDLLKETNLLSPTEYNSIMQDCKELLRLLISSVKTLRSENK
jgi:four helix bundle protein